MEKTYGNQPRAIPTGNKPFRPKFWFIGLYLFLVICYLALIPVPRSDNHLLSSDGGYYYSYMRSFLLDHDTDIANDIELYNSRVTPDNPGRLKEWYVFSVGPALLWSPFFLAAHGLALGLSKLGISVATDGFSFVEEAAVCLAAISYGMLGLYLIYRTLLRMASRGISFTTVLTLFLSSFACYYFIFEPSMSHTLELFTAALFVWVLLGRDRKGYRDWFLVGLAAGLMALVRWQNAVFLPLIILKLFAPVPPPAGRHNRTVLARVLIMAAGLVPLAALQCIFWKAVFGAWVTVPQGAGFLNATKPQMLQVLFSLRHGLFTWHPVFLIAFIGFIFVRPKSLAATLALLVIIQIYICGIVADWWGGDSFGMRRMTGTIPLFAFGLASLLERWKRKSKWKFRFAFFLLALLVCWNFLFIVQYRLDLIPKNAAPNLRQLTVEKLLIIRKLGK